MTSKSKIQIIGRNDKSNSKSTPPQSSPALRAREEAKSKIKIKMNYQPFGY